MRRKWCRTPFLLVLAFGAFGAYGAACFPGTQVIDAPAPPPCSGTRLTAGMPQPHAPYVSTLAWLDASTLVIAVGATTFEQPLADGTMGMFQDTADATGLVVLDTQSGTVVRAWHGLDAYSLVPRRGSTSELLFAEVAKIGRDQRVGRVDLVSGCVTATTWMSDVDVELDAPDDQILVAHDRDHANTAELLDAATLSAKPAGPLLPHSFTSFDATSRSFVSIEVGHGIIEVRDARTLALRGHRDVGAELVRWTLRPGHAQSLASYVKRCKLRPARHPGAMREASCEPGSRQTTGLVRLSLDTLADVSRSVEDDDDMIELFRHSWQPSGAQAIVQCARLGEALCLWDPDTGAKTPLAPMPLAYTINQIAWRDDDVFAAASNDQKVVLRSLSRGAQLASFALPHL